MREPEFNDRGKVLPTGELTIEFAQINRTNKAVVFLTVHARDEAGILWDTSHTNFVGDMKWIPPFPNLVGTYGIVAHGKNDCYKIKYEVQASSFDEAVEKIKAIPYNSYVSFEHQTFKKADPKAEEIKHVQFL